MADHRRHAGRAGLGPLPGGTFSTQLPVQVAGVQAINNG